MYLNRNEIARRTREVRAGCSDLQAQLKERASFVENERTKGREVLALRKTGKKRKEMKKNGVERREREENGGRREHSICCNRIRTSVRVCKNEGYRKRHEKEVPADYLLIKFTEYVELKSSHFSFCLVIT